MKKFEKVPNIVVGIKDGQAFESSLDEVKIPYPQKDGSFLEYLSNGELFGLYFNNGSGNSREAVGMVKVLGETLYRNEDILSEYKELRNVDESSK